MTRMEELIERINAASNAYYNGKEIMTNKEFDELVAELQELEIQEGKVLPGSPTRNVGALVTDSLPKFKHTYPALSLDKTKDTAEFISKFRKGIEDSNSYNDFIVLMWKEDGSTVQAYYNNGHLDKLVTRGNGEVGSIITHNLKCLAGIPEEIPYQGELVVRGEALMSYDEFERVNSQLPIEEQYKNPRNLAAATLSILNPEEACQRHLQFKAFNLVKCEIDVPEVHTFSGRLALLEKAGFDVVEHKLLAIDHLAEGIEAMSESVDDYPYPVDGLVAALDNYDYASTLPGTEHHPNVLNGYAFKWADETVETTLREIEWSPSRTGLLNPVAIFDPVELEGTTVKRASLHNLSIMRKMRIHVGDKITVYKANKIIPVVDANLSYDEESDYTEDFIEELIGVCPTCGSKAEVHVSADGIETVYCPNENCPEKLIGNFVNFCSRDGLDIQGMSEETIKKLVDRGFIKKYSDFFTLMNKPAISLLPGFGKQSWAKMCEAAEKAKTTDFVHFFTALSIPNIGKGQLKALKQFLTSNYTELTRMYGLNSEVFNLPVLLSTMGCNNFNFAKIDGFGDILGYGLSKWLKEKFNPDVLTSELELLGYVQFTDRAESLSSANKSTAVSGKSFCITGKLIHFSNRQELVDKIEAAGGKWVDSVSSKTDYLINNDVTSTSGKNKKAMELNIPIISEEDFLKMI